MPSTISATIDKASVSFITASVAASDAGIDSTHEIASLMVSSHTVFFDKLFLLGTSLMVFTY